MEGLDLLFCWVGLGTFDQKWVAAQFLRYLLTIKSIFMKAIFCRGCNQVISVPLGRDSVECGCGKGFLRRTDVGDWEYGGDVAIPLDFDYIGLCDAAYSRYGSYGVGGEVYIGLSVLCEDREGFKRVQ